MLTNNILKLVFYFELKKKFERKGKKKNEVKKEKPFIVLKIDVIASFYQLFGDAHVTFCARPPVE